MYLKYSVGALFAVAAMVLGNYAFAAESIWDHNGSQMRWLSDGSDRQIYYNDPKPELRQAGVEIGTLLFSGKRVGNRLSGTAFTFKSGCRPAPYAVEGIVQSETEVILRGTAPSRKISCEVEGYVWNSPHSTLRFSYIANSSPPNVIASPARSDESKASRTSSSTLNRPIQSADVSQLSRHDGDQQRSEISKKGDTADIQQRAEIAKEGEPEDILVLYNPSAAGAAGVTRTLSGKINVPSRYALCANRELVKRMRTEGDVQEYVLEQLKNSLGASTSGMRDCMTGASEPLFLVDRFTYRTRSCPKSQTICNDMELVDTFAAAGFRDFRAGKEAERARIAQAAEEHKAREYAEAQSREAFARANDASLTSGSAKGFGLVEVTAGPVVCTINEPQVAAIEKLMQSRPEYAADNKRMLRVNTVDDIFLRLKDRTCNALFGRAEDLATITKALTRDRTAYRVHWQWLGEETLAGAAVLAEKERREREDRQKLEARRREQEAETERRQAQAVSAELASAGQKRIISDTSTSGQALTADSLPEMRGTFNKNELKFHRDYAGRPFTAKGIFSRSTKETTVSGPKAKVIVKTGDGDVACLTTNVFILDRTANWNPGQQVRIEGLIETVSGNEIYLDSDCDVTGQ